MADYATRNASDGEVIAIAERMVYNQKFEVTEYTRSLDRLPKS
jgi:uncharacterized protein (DUF305 family)